MNILEIRSRAPKGSFKEYDGAWYNLEGFARKTKVNFRWYLIPKTVLENSLDKSYQFQDAMVKEGEEQPRAVEIVFMTVFYMKATGQYLFRDSLVLCRDLDRHKDRILVGCLFEPRLDITYWHPEHCDYDVGSVPSRLPEV